MKNDLASEMNSTTNNINKSIKKDKDKYIKKNRDIEKIK